MLVVKRNNAYGDEPVLPSGAAAASPVSQPERTAAAPETAPTIVEQKPIEGGSNALSGIAPASEKAPAPAEAAAPQAAAPGR